ncbi:Alpha/Beta hydrolase protein [Emericellopsis atlantica]|uniref:Alpha/Beta hydrolase protein n=1 Tax=Emericellopsis atlantica TaxID=2614577 RepID=A0A9P7ZF81_9HYPO|nr:Alpha/Beta hydrolase protein [Emericellopsis atlantica]KAG9250989.1 Alpha/Beta hydrolase protein [Emericellopsis atlantica]
MAHPSEKSARSTSSREDQDNHPSPRRSPWAYFSTLVVVASLTVFIYPASWRTLISTFSALNAESTTSYPHETIQWTSCGSTAGHPLECANLTVPLDHFNASNPDTVQFPIIRLRGKSAGAGRNLLVNPGGPGNSGIDYVTKGGKHINTLVGEDYHIVSWAPRGTKGTVPMAKCYPDDATRKQHGSFRNRDIVADSPDVYAWAKNFAQACRDTTGPGVEYINTPQTAADMNSILDALGQEKLHYWGLSYGTLLGQTYAMLFPERAGRMVFDGVANVFQYYISEPDMEMMTDSDRTFVGFLEECVAAGDDCPLTHVSTSKDVLLEKFTALGEQLDRQPLSVYVNSTHYGTLDFRTLFIDVIFPHFQVLSGWHLLASKLAPLLQGNATDFFLQYGQMSQSSINMDAFHMIMSNDGLTGPAHWPQDRESLLEEILPKLRVSMFARLANERFYIKQQWKIPRTHSFSPYQDVKLETPPLIFTQRYDAVTPVVSAISARDAFPGSRMVTINGYGHCSIALPSLCSARILREYLNKGKLPEDHEECEVDGPIFVKKGEEDDRIPKHVWDDEEKRSTYMAMRDFIKDLIEG